MYMRKRRGPRTEPCGTPELTGQGKESELFADTNCVLLERKFSIHARMLESMFSFFFFLILSRAVGEGLNQRLSKNQEICSRLKDYCLAQKKDRS